MTTFPSKDAGNGEVFTVEEVEDGVFQSVFPTPLAHRSSLHTSVEDAWAYVLEIAGAEWPVEELTPEGVQLVIPGAEKRLPATAKQMELW